MPQSSSVVLSIFSSFMDMQVKSPAEAQPSMINQMIRILLERPSSTWLRRGSCGRRTDGRGLYAISAPWTQALSEEVGRDALLDLILEDDGSNVVPSMPHVTEYVRTNVKEANAGRLPWWDRVAACAGNVDPAPTTGWNPTHSPSLELALRRARSPVSIMMRQRLSGLEQLEAVMKGFQPCSVYTPVDANRPCTMYRT